MADQNLCQLAYISESVLPEDAFTDVNMLQDILDVSKRNNERDGITGALLWSGSHFAQILEGEEKRVLGLFDRIKQDARHRNVYDLTFNNVDHRSFPEWSMAMAVLDPSQIIGLHEVHANTDPITASQSGMRLLDFMEQLVVRRESSKPIPVQV